MREDRTARSDIEHQRRVLGTEPLATILVKFLDDASLALKSNNGNVDASIARATAFLFAERDRDIVRPAGPKRGGLAPWQIRAVEAFIAAHLDRKILQEELAAVTNLSVSHFAAAFKQSFGEPPHASLIRRRIRLAQEMMLTTQEPLSQIALACGLGDQAHFSTVFRQKTGSTPNAWRREKHRCAALAAAA
jgi:AraC-like DNA-binding protein